MRQNRQSIDRHTELVADSSAPDLKIPAEACLVERELDPCAIVIFGATGDLTMRKLAPSLYNLFMSGCLPPRFSVLAAGRRNLTDEEFRGRVRKALGHLDLSGWDAFESCLLYRQIGFDSLDSFSELTRSLHSLDRDRDLHGNAIFYLAVPPSSYESAVQLLGMSGLSREGVDGTGWRRLVVEKPFGRDLPSCRHLNGVIEEHFTERQVFRIDHYLAKETVQNVLVLRFANAIFEPLWNRQFIDRVHVVAAESLGVENRAPYYEESGVLRDMFQNHMMQLLALTAMEPPSSFEADYVRDETSKVFRSLRPWDLKNLDREVLLGQYGRGTVDGEPVAAYRQEPGVRQNSCVPTFATLRVFVDNWRWEGVPFFLTSGKRLRSKLTHIVIDFKRVPHSLFRGVLGDVIAPNALRLGVYPDESVTLTFQTKNPGARFRLRPVVMNFNYTDNYTGPSIDAYEKALLDCMQGDQTLFWRQDAVELSWAFLDPLLEGCERSGDQESRLHTYEAGSWGPEPALEPISLPSPALGIV